MYGNRPVPGPLIPPRRTGQPLNPEAEAAMRAAENARAAEDAQETGTGR